MIELSLDPTQIESIYFGGDKNARNTMKKVLGDKFQEVLPVKDRVKSFDDAYKELGEDHQYCEEYRAIRYSYVENLSPDLLAFVKLRVITAALNEGWEPAFTDDETRYYPWFQLYRKDEIEEMSDDLVDDLKLKVVDDTPGNDSYIGLACVYHGENFAPSSARCCGSRLAFKSEELSAYAAKQFAGLYSDFIFKPEKKSDKK